MQKNKLQQQLKQKEEMGEVLHAIDFDQLQIENSQFLSKIEEKNTELAALKLKTANILGTLNNFKKKLEHVGKDSEKSIHEMHQRKELIKKLARETGSVGQDKERANKNFIVLKKELDDYKVPEVD